MNKKLLQFKKRNRERNIALYNNNLIEGIDYIICPVSKERLSMIKKNYIKNILNMQIEEYNKLYPDIQKVSKRRKKNIKDGLAIIDKSTGLTKHQLSVKKTKITLSKKESNGLTKYQNKGRKTRNTHLNNIDKFGKNGYAQIAQKAIIKGNKTKALRGLINDPALKNEYYRYKRLILYLTGKIRDGVATGYYIGKCGEKDAYQIDHKYSIFQGFKNKISPLIIAHKNNLEILPWRDNIVKHTKSSIDLEWLLKKTGYSSLQSKKEFIDILKIIKEDINFNIPTSSSYVIERYYETKIKNK